MAQSINHSRQRSRYLVVLAGWLLSAAFTGGAFAQVQDIDWLMFRDPKLPTPDVQISFPPGLSEVWRNALEEPQRDFKRRAAAAIIEGHHRGVSGLETAVPQLEELLADPDAEKAVRLTAAQALVTLDARRSATLLFESLGEDLDMAEVVEPALARWSHPPARDMWLKRLDTNIVLRRAHVLAIEGLTEVGSREALPRFLKLATDRRTPASVRLAAANGLGQLQVSGLEQVARKLMQDRSPAAFVDRLVAARILKSHRGDEVVPILLDLAQDPMPAIQSVALRHLLRIDPKHVTSLADQLIGSRDVEVRRRVAEGLVAVASDPAPALIGPLCTLLDDRNPSLRRYVRESLTELASDEALSDTVFNEARAVLNQNAWRGQQQAAQMLTILDDKSIVDRLLELLESPRPEVHTTAAWGLCQLNVPETIESIFSVFRRKTERALASERQVEDTQTQLAHLAQAIGRMKYAPADSELRKYVPKGTTLNPMCRAAAIWALGHLHADEMDETLVRQLEQRMTDVNSLEPEDTLVRRMSAVSLGRMKAEQTLRSLRRMMRHDGTNAAPGIACGWAIHQITGDPLPVVTPVPYVDNDWFLIPDITVQLPGTKDR